MVSMEDVREYLAKAREGKGNIGLFAIGHKVYWAQFPGLEEALYRHYQHFSSRLRKDAKANIVVCEQMSEDYRSAYEAGVYLCSKKIDLLICYVATYAPSAHAVTVVQGVRNVPVLVVCMQPSPGMEYVQATMHTQLENDNVTCLPEVNNGLIRSNRPAIDCVVGMLYDDERAWKRILDWCEVATVVRRLRNDHIGYMGHGYEGMLDMNSDPTMFEGHFGMHIEHTSMEDLEMLVDGATDSEVEQKIKQIESTFDFPEPGADSIAEKVEPCDLVWPARVAVGMEKLVTEMRLTGLAYYYRGLNADKFERLHSGMIIGNSFLTSAGIAIAGELDVKNCVAMLITDRLEAGGSFAEFHPVDFREDFVLVGHDGPHHLAIAEGRPVLRRLKLLHGKRGRGASVEYKLKVGPITQVGLTQDFSGSFKFVVAEGHSLSGPIPATGNTNTRGRFKPDVRTFLERWSLQGATHHFALGVGHYAHKIEMIAKYLGIKCVRVTPTENP